MEFDRATLDKLFQYCMVLHGDRDAAYDLLHHAIEKYLQQSPGGIENPMAYIRRIARNAFLDGVRRENTLPFEPLPDPDHYAGAERLLEALIIDQVTLDRVWRVLQPAEREVLYFWALHDMSATEIGWHLNQPRSTILARMHRLRKRMREVYPAAESGGNHD